MKRITKRELIDIISNNKGCEAISIDIETHPRMKKIGNPFEGVIKVCSLSGLIGFNYENSVNNQLERENKERNFRAQERIWGKHYNPYFIIHNDNFYLNIKVQFASESKYFLNGKEIKVEEILPYLYESKKPHTQDNLKNEIVVRTVKIDSIKRLRYKGEEYIIEN